MKPVSSTSPSSSELTNRDSMSVQDATRKMYERALADGLRRVQRIDAIEDQFTTRVLPRVSITHPEMQPQMLQIQKMLPGVRKESSEHVDRLNNSWRFYEDTGFAVFSGDQFRDTLEMCQRNLESKDPLPLIAAALGFDL